MPIGPRTTSCLCVIFALLYSTASPAQDEAAEEISALRQLVKEQNRLISEQANRLEALTERVAELEGRTESGAATVRDVTPDDGAESTEPRHVAQAEAPGDERTEPLDADELALNDVQEQRTGVEAVIVEDPVVLSEFLDIYGSMRLFAEAGGGSTELKDGPSRLGFRLGRELQNGPAFFGRIEWKTNLVNDRSVFAVGDSSGSGIAIRRGDSGDAISLRLGYLGVRFDRIGEFSVGKQWSTYTDVAGWTNAFNIYGGAGLSSFPGGTDGGDLGTGRADNAIVWRNRSGRFSYGLQTQLKDTDDGEDYRNLGGSLIFAPTSEWRMGAAFSASTIKGGFVDLTGDDESSIAVVGVRYASAPWTIALSVASWENHESVFFDEDLIFYDGEGAELYVGYDFPNRFTVYGGINYTDPDIDDPRIDPDFGVERWILGASFFTTQQSYAFVEALLNNGTGPAGNSPDSVMAAGYRFDF